MVAPRPALLPARRSDPVRGFVLVRDGRPAELLFWPGDELVIGRSQESDLVLDHATVSMFHARVLQGRQHVTIEDLASRNGTLRRGEPVEQAVLVDGDALRIGPWSLEYCADLRGDRRGLDRRLGSLPRRVVRRRERDPALDALAELGSGTFMVDASVLSALAAGDELRSRARLVPEAGGRPTHVGVNALSLGRSGDVWVPGWFCGGHAAVVRWDGAAHVLERRSWFARIEVNGRRVRVARLRRGDRVRVGESTFRYLTR